MSFRSIQAKGSVALLEQAKAATVRAPSGRSTRLVCSARYGYEEDAPARRSGRKNFDDGDFDGGYEQRGGRGGRSSYKSWDDDFDAPSRMNRSRQSRDDDFGDASFSEDISGRFAPAGQQGERSGEGQRAGRGGYGGRGGRGEGGYGGRGGRGRGQFQRRREAGEEGGEAGGEGYEGRPRRNFDGERRFDGERSGGERRTFRGPREAMSSEQLAQRGALNQAIRDAAGWRDLARFVEEKGSMMDAENAAQILFKLSYRPISRGGDSPRGSNAFERPRDETSAQEYDRLLSMLLGWVLVLLPSFRPRQVSTSLQALAKLELWNLEVINALVERATTHMLNFEGQELANMMWAFAKFNYSPGQAFFDEFLTRSGRKLASMTAVDLGRTAVAMSKVGCVPTAEWGEAFWNASGDKVGEFTEYVTGDIMMAVGYFAQCDVQPPQRWVDYVFGHLLETADTKAARAAQQKQQQTAAQAAAEQQGEAVAKPSAPAAADKPLPKVYTLNKMLYTLASLKARPSPQWFAALVEAWKRQFAYCSPSDLGNISLLLGRYLGVPLPQDTAEKLMREAMKVQSKMSADDLAAVAYLLAVSQFKGRERDIDDLVYLIKGNLGACTAAGLEMVFNSLKVLGSGYRINETCAQAEARFNELMAAQQQQAGEAGSEAVASEPVSA